MSKDTESTEQSRQLDTRFELRAFLRKDERGEYLPPIGNNVLVEIRQTDRASGEVIQDWTELGTRSLTFTVDAGSVLWAQVDLPLVEFDLGAVPKPGTFDVPEGVIAETSEEKL